MIFDRALMARDGAILTVQCHYSKVIREAAPPLAKSERITSKLIGPPFLALDLLWLA